MSIEIKVPTLPESVSDATVVAWHKKTGDRVRRDENLVDLETDKVILEVPAIADGVVGEIFYPVGSVVKSDMLLACLNPITESKASAESAASKTEQSTATSTPPVKETVQQKSAETVQSSIMGPAARRTASELGVATEHMTGTGVKGRITRSDILNQAAVSHRSENRVPMTRLRARIAERLLAAKQNTAMLTTFNEINMKAVMDLRASYKDAFEKRHQVRLGFMSFFTKAVIEALKRFPAVNASIEGTDVIYHQYYDIGIAVSTDRGLVVPILRNTELMGFADIERAIADYGRRARDAQITIEELTGGTFTITNGGVFGSLLSTPILNPPQSAILGMHKIEERPIVEQGQIVIRPMMYIALSYDHRVIDGKESVGFLVAVKEFLEDPARLLLDV